MLSASAGGFSGGTDRHPITGRIEKRGAADAEAKRLPYEELEGRKVFVVEGQMLPWLSSFSGSTPQI
jgi:hypothetical protein